MEWGYRRGDELGAAMRADLAGMKADRYSDKVDELKNQLERLSLACQAMWEMLRDRSNATEEELDAKILEIDARDGHVDGKISTRSLTCHACGKPTNSRRSFCVICGAPVQRQHKFEV